VNLKASGDTDVVVPALKQPILSTRHAPAVQDSEGEWLCAWCHTLVANEQERLRLEGKDEFTFTNPAGIRFEILTFFRTQGCCQTGVPTFQHTWFPGHAWSYCQCVECGEHLGWYFTGPQNFAGLIRDRVVRALHLRN
jgi:hypothetical protein